MTTKNSPSQLTPADDVQDMVAQADTGARHPGGIQGRILWFVPLCWSLFQLWYASPLPFIFDFGVLNDTQARSIHLMFAIFLAFTAYPAFKRSPRDTIPPSIGFWHWPAVSPPPTFIFSTTNSLTAQVHQRNWTFSPRSLVWSCFSKRRAGR